MWLYVLFSTETNKQESTILVLSNSSGTTCAEFGQNKHTHTADPLQCFFSSLPIIGKTGQ